MYNILVVRVQANAALLGLDPDLGNILVFVGLVDNLGNHLWPLFDQAGVQLGMLNCVSAAILHEQP